jgi:hypothetical protein
VKKKKKKKPVLLSPPKHDSCDDCKAGFALLFLILLNLSPPSRLFFFSLSLSRLKEKQASFERVFKE